MTPSRQLPLPRGRRVTSSTSDWSSGHRDEMHVHRPGRSAPTNRVPTFRRIARLGHDASCAHADDAASATTSDSSTRASRTQGRHLSSEYAAGSSPTSIATVRSRNMKRAARVCVHPAINLACPMLGELRARALQENGRGDVAFGRVRRARRWPKPRPWLTARRGRDVRFR